MEEVADENRFVRHHRDYNQMKAKTFHLVTTTQLFLASLLIGVVAGGLSVLNTEYQKYNLLPTVVKTNTDECVRVISYANGHVFTCNDVGAVLRQYRTQIVDGGS